MAHLDILVTGGSGQVGLELSALRWPEDVRVHAPGRDILNLADGASIERVMAARPWAAVVSGGAYTAVDAAESDVAAAWTANALAPAILAARAAAAGIPVVHLSTDYVFAGDKDGFYVEDDPVAPLGVYGASKEGGEQAVRTANPRHVILRTAWVVSRHRRNFLATMLRLARERDEVSVVADQHGCPTFAGDLAAAIQAVTLRFLREGDTPTGTYHFVNAGEATWAEFATAIFAASAKRGGPGAVVKPIPTSAWPTAAKRPANSRLATAKIQRDFAIAPRPWREALDETIRGLT